MNESQATVESISSQSSQEQEEQSNATSPTAPALTEEVTTAMPDLNANDSMIDLKSCVN